jgi:chromosome segregation ATPase
LSEVCSNILALSYQNCDPFIAESKWQAEVLKSFQDMVLEADKHRQGAVTDARIAMDEVELLSTRIRALERAKEEAVQSADALAARLSVSASLADKEKNIACNQYAEKLSARDEQVASLQKQLSHAHSQVQQASHQAREASAAEAAYVSEIQHLNASLKELRSHLQCVTSECSSMKIELSGHASGSEQHRHAAVDARDSAIKDYFLAHVMPQLRIGCASTSDSQHIHCQVLRATY